jgi:hypothetical protein
MKFRKFIMDFSEKKIHLDHDQTIIHFLKFLIPSEKMVLKIRFYATYKTQKIPFIVVS